MAKDAALRKPAGSDFTEHRTSEPGAPAFEKAPPDACAIRPWALKLHGLDVQQGELQGTLEHVKVIAGKHRAFWGSLCEWVSVEGERI